MASWLAHLSTDGPRTSRSYRPRSLRHSISPESSRCWYRQRDEIDCGCKLIGAGTVGWHSRSTSPAPLPGERSLDDNWERDTATGSFTRSSARECFAGGVGGELLRSTTIIEPNGRQSRMPSAPRGHGPGRSCRPYATRKACPSEVARPVFRWLVVARTGRSEGIPIA